MRNARELSDRHRCPCGSRTFYANCCKKQAFKWVRDSRGRVRQFVPLSKEGVRAWKEYIRVSDAEFRSAFGRPRRRGERLDPGSHFERNGAFTNEVSEAMEAAGADPAR